MKQLIVLTGIVLTAYLVLVTTVPSQSQAPAAAAAQLEQSASESGYRLSVADGRVAVYRDGDLYLKTETMVSSLPKSDQNRLAKGIDVLSLKEVKELLQDYCS